MSAHHTILLLPRLFIISLLVRIISIIEHHPRRVLACRSRSSLVRSFARCCSSHNLLLRVMRGVVLLAPRPPLVRGDTNSSSSFIAPRVALDRRSHNN